MDLADASLMVLAEEMEVYAIATLDRDFYIYRARKHTALQNLLSDIL